MKKFSYLVYWLASLLVLVGCGSQPSAVSVQPTVDPFVALANEQATNQASEQKIELLSGQLTATAEAPIVAITQQAAALIVEQTQVSMNRTATAVSWTPTPTSTPTIVPTATMNIPATGTAESILLEVDRNRSTNTANAMAVYVVGFVFLVGAMMLLIAWAKRLSVIPNPTNEQGKPLPMLDVVEGSLIDIDRAPNGVMNFKASYLKQLPAITAEIQRDVTNRAQLVDMQTRRGKLPKRLIESQSMSANNNEAVALPESVDSLFPLPSWDLVKSWNKDRDMLPLGNSNNGLEYWDLKNHPHLAVFGMTRSGKDRRLLRPLIAFMLASRQRVVNLGKETDYLPFMNHPNAVFVPVYDITERDEAIKYVNALEACVEEKNRRIKLMAERGISLWEWERTFIVLGELGNAMLEMDKDLAEHAMKKARSMVNEGAKAGMSLVFSSQRPKGFVDLNTQCGRVTFQVENETERNYALGMKSAGLPEIPVGYFYKKFRGLTITGGFEPSDDELRQYLDTHHATMLPKADWIEGVVKQNQIESQPETRSLPEVEPIVDEIQQMADSIRGQWTSEMSGRQVASLLGLSQYGGSYKAKVDKVVARLSATTNSTTTTENTQNIGEFGVVAA